MGGIDVIVAVYVLIDRSTYHIHLSTCTHAGRDVRFALVIRLDDVGVDPRLGHGFKGEDAALRKYDSPILVSNNEATHSISARGNEPGRVIGLDQEQSPIAGLV